MSYDLFFFRLNPEVEFKRVDEYFERYLDDCENEESGEASGAPDGPIDEDFELDEALRFMAKPMLKAFYPPDERSEELIFHRAQVRCELQILCFSQEVSFNSIEVLELFWIVLIGLDHFRE